MVSTIYGECKAPWRFASNLFRLLRFAAEFRELLRSLNAVFIFDDYGHYVATRRHFEAATRPKPSFLFVCVARCDVLRPSRVNVVFGQIAAELARMEFVVRFPPERRNNRTRVLKEPRATGRITHGFDNASQRDGPQLEIRVSLPFAFEVFRSRRSKIGARRETHDEYRSKRQDRPQRVIQRSSLAPVVRHKVRIDERNRSASIAHGFNAAVVFKIESEAAKPGVGPRSQSVTAFIEERYNVLAVVGQHDCSAVNEFVDFSQTRINERFTLFGQTVRV